MTVKKLDKKARKEHKKQRDQRKAKRNRWQSAA